MKRKVISPGEEFIMADEVWSYTISEDKSIQLKKVKGGKVPKPKSTFIPPSLDEVKAWFKAEGYSEEGAIKAFKYYEDGNWTDRNGDQVKNWKQKMRVNWLKPEYKIAIKPENNIGENLIALGKNMKK